MGVSHNPLQKVSPLTQCSGPIFSPPKSRPSIIGLKLIFTLISHLFYNLYQFKTQISHPFLTQFQNSFLNSGYVSNASSSMQDSLISQLKEGILCSTEATWFFFYLVFSFVVQFGVDLYVILITLWLILEWTTSFSHFSITPNLSTVLHM